MDKMSAVIVNFGLLFSQQSIVYAANQSHLEHQEVLTEMERKKNETPYLQLLRSRFHRLLRR